MAAGGKRADAARQRARDIRVTVGREIRAARRAGGVSLRAAGAVVGISPSAFGRIERGVEPSVTLERICLASAAVGLAFNGRAFLDGEPIRDAGHARLLTRLRALLPGGTGLRFEVPIPGSVRATDAQARLTGHSVGFEAETRLDDIQALVRKTTLKKRDAGLDVLVLVVADTRHNRRVVAEQRALISAAFPTGPRTALSALRDGVAPAADAVIVL